MGTDLIRFSEPETAGNPQVSLQRITSIESGGEYYREACSLLQGIVPTDGIFLTASGSQALEFAVMLAQVGQGDEVVMPSYTYYSTANAFLAAGASVVFVDIDPDTMTMDASLVEAAVTESTKAVVAVHYGGVSPDMDKLLEICDRQGLILIEDAAQSIGASYKERPLGTIGALGILSFHATKNVTSGGEGGALLVNDSSLIEHAPNDLPARDRSPEIPRQGRVITIPGIPSAPPTCSGSSPAHGLPHSLGNSVPYSPGGENSGSCTGNCLSPWLRRGSYPSRGYRPGTTITAISSTSSAEMPVNALDCRDTSPSSAYRRRPTTSRFIPPPTGRTIPGSPGQTAIPSMRQAACFGSRSITNLTDEQVDAVCHGIHEFYGVSSDD